MKRRQFDKYYFRKLFLWGRKLSVRIRGIDCKENTETRRHVTSRQSHACHAPVDVKSTTKELVRTCDFRCIYSDSRRLDFVKYKLGRAREDGVVRSLLIVSLISLRMGPHHLSWIRCGRWMQSTFLL